jgi:tryptophan-rich sensory protein
MTFTRESKLRSKWQPPGWVFIVAWSLQAISLGFVGQGISETNDTTIKLMWTIWSALLGPL